MKDKVLKDIVSLVILIVALLITFSCLGTAEVSGSSMNPTFVEEDFLILHKGKDVKDGDVIAVYSEQLGKLLIKRVIGVAGDHVVIDDNGVVVNNEVLKEPYLNEEDWESAKLDLVVGDDEVFVMGDNRNHSTDSRELGCLKVSDIYGKFIFNVTKTLNLKKESLSGIIIICWALLGLISLLSLKKKREGSENGL